MPTPEDKAREEIDKALDQAGWKVQDLKSANLGAGRGVALRNFPLQHGHGFADARPMEKKPSVAFEKLLQAVALGNTEEDVLTSIAGRLARMEHRITKEDEQAISKTSGSFSLKDLSRRIVEPRQISLSP